MSDHDDLNGLDAKINWRGFFERILQERDRTEEEYRQRIEERFEGLAENLKLQAAEYERRLHNLNGEYLRDRQRQADYVTEDKYEDRMKAEEKARLLALDRVDEKLSEHIKRYELRHEEMRLAQATFVTSEKYEDKLSAEAQARAAALKRVDEQFSDYVRRWEQRERETELRLAAQEQNAQNAERSAEKAAVLAKAAAEEQGRKSNRNIGIASVVLTFVIIVANLLGALPHG